MTRQQAKRVLQTLQLSCQKCQPTSTKSQSLIAHVQRQRRHFTTSGSASSELQIQAAPEIPLEDQSTLPARIIPVSPSYFTASPTLNDNILLLRTLVRQHESLPTVEADKAPRILWKKFSQYKAEIGEPVATSKYAKILVLLSRLNKIQPSLRPSKVRSVMEWFRRPGGTNLETRKPLELDEHGRARAIGRRKESTARVYLVEGSGEVLINGKNLLQAFPRMHDRESALWPLKVTERMNKYNVWVLVNGGGVTGQAESVTLALARALLVHEPALKPVLRKAGCVTADARRVERKKPGHRKARKMPQWVKR